MPDALILPVLAKRHLEPICLFDNVPGRVDKATTRLGQRHAAGRADQQTCAQTLLQQLDLTAQRGGEHVEVLRRPAKVKRVRDGN